MAKLTSEYMRSLINSAYEQRSRYTSAQSPQVEENRRILEQSKPVNQLNTYNPSVARTRAVAAQNRAQATQNAENRARAVYTRENALAEDTLGESDVYAANKAAGVEATYAAQKQHERQGADVIGVPNPVTQKLTLQNAASPVASQRVSSARPVTVRNANLETPARVTPISERPVTVQNANAAKPVTVKTEEETVLRNAAAAAPVTVQGANRGGNTAAATTGEIKKYEDALQAYSDEHKSELEQIKKIEGGGGSLVYTAQEWDVVNTVNGLKNKINSLRASLSAGKTAVEHDAPAVNLYESAKNSREYDTAVASVNDVVKSAQDSGNEYVRMALDKSWRATKGLAHGIETTRFSKYDYLNNDELNNVKFYLATGDATSAQNYLESLESKLNERVSTLAVSKAKEQSYDNPALGVLYNVALQFSAPEAFTRTAIQSIYNKVTGSKTPADTNAPEYLGAAIVNTSGEQVAQRAYDEAYKATGSETAAKWAQFFTSTGVSVAQNLARYPVALVSVPLSLGIMSSSVAGTTTKSMLDSGSSVDEALLLGTVSGAIEYVTEKVPLDSLIKILKSDSAPNIVQIITNVLGQSATEFGEESISEIANTVADIVVRQDRSEFNKYVEYLKSTGKSEGEAIRSAAWQMFVYNTLEAGAAGGLSGGFMGGAATLISASMNKSIYTQHSYDVGQSIKSSGKASDVLTKSLSMLRPETALYKDAAKYSANPDSAPNILLGNLANAMNTYSMTGGKTKTALPETVESALTQLFVSNKQAESIINDPASLKSFEDMTGQRITGTTMSQKRASVRDIISAYQAKIDNADIISMAVELNRTNSESAQRLLLSGIASLEQNINLARNANIPIEDKKSAINNGLKRVADLKEINTKIRNGTFTEADEVKTVAPVSSFKAPEAIISEANIAPAETDAVQPNITEETPVQLSETTVEQPTTAENISEQITAQPETDTVQNPVETTQRDDSVTPSNSPSAPVAQENASEGVSGEAQSAVPETTAENAEVGYSITESKGENGEPVYIVTPSETLTGPALEVYNSKMSKAGGTYSDAGYVFDDLDSANRAVRSEPEPEVVSPMKTPPRDVSTRLELFASQISDALSKYGIKVELADLGAEENGKYDPDKKTIYLNKSLPTDKYSVVWHEAFHAAADSDSSLVNDTVEAMKKVERYDDETYQRTEKRYREHLSYIGLSEEQINGIATDRYINEEICAEFLREIAEDTDSDLAEKFATENKGLIARLWAAIKKLLAKLSGKSEMYADTKEIADGIRKLVEKYTGFDVGEASDTGKNSTEARFSVDENEESDDNVKYWRGTFGADPMSEWGHAMFGNAINKAYINTAGGKNSRAYAWTYDGKEGVDAADLRDAIVELWNKDRENEFSDYYGSDLSDYINVTGEEIAEAANPDNILDSAQLYDNGELLEWFWNRVLEPRGIKAVLTYDGAIVFDRDLINNYKKYTTGNTNKVRYSLSGGTETLTELDAEYMKSVEDGDAEKAQRMVNQRAEELKAEVFAMTDVPTYTIRRGAMPKKTIKVYKVFTLSDNGKPSALFISSQHELPVGVWLDAQDTWHFTAKNGNQYVPSTQNPWTAGGKTGGMVEIPNEEIRAELIKRGFLPEGSKAKSVTALAYRPGWHAGDLPYFPQGGMKREGSNYPNIHRYNQVIFECELPADTDYTEYARSQDKAKSKSGETVNARADLQEMPANGFYEYSTNPLTQRNDLGKWYIGGSLKIGRALTQAECDAILEKNGRLPQEWEQGTLDLDALKYDPTATDGGKKLLDAVTYDDDGKVIPLSQRFNSEIKDPRYSLSGDEDIIRDNAKLKKENERLKKQFEITEQATTDPEKTRAYAKRLAKYNFISDDAESVDGLSANLQSLYDKMANTHDKEGEQQYSWEGIRAEAEAIASSIIDKALVENDEAYQNYKGLRDYLRTTAIYVNEKDRPDIEGYDNFKEARQKNFGRLRLSNDGTPIETVYQELFHLYPEFFSEEADHPAKQFNNIVSVLNSLKPIYVNPFSQNLEAAKTYLTDSILENFFDIPQQKPTFADKAEKRVEEATAAGARKLETEKAKSAKQAQEYEKKLDKKDDQIMTERWLNAEQNLVNLIESSKALEKERRRREDAIEKLTQKYRERDVKKSLKRERAILNKSITHGMNKLYQMLMRPNDKKHIPADLVGAVASFIEGLKATDQKTSQAHFYKSMASADKLKKLADQDNRDYTEVLDPDLIDNLTEISGYISDIKEWRETEGDETINAVKFFDNEQLKLLNNTVKALLHAVSDANKTLTASQNRYVSEMATSIMEENESEKVYPDSPKRTFKEAGRNLLRFDMLTPETFFTTLGKAGYAIYNEIHDGQKTFTDDVDDAAKYLLGALKGVDQSVIDDMTGTSKKSLKIKLTNGKNINLTLGQAMSLYELAKRDQAYKHIISKKGGVITERHYDGNKVIKQIDPVKMTQEDVDIIVSSLTDEQKRIADAIAEYFSYISKWGNEVSRTLYGYDKYGEENYFPIHTAENFTPEQMGGYVADPRIINKGWTKQTVRNASNPIVVSNIFDVFDRHVSEMAAYHAYAVPLTNFEKVFNYSSSEGGVRAALEKKYGTAALRYIRDFINEINGRAVRGEVGTEISSKLLRNFKAASVGFNPSVIIKQPFSIIRAATIIDPKYLAVESLKGFSEDSKNEMLKYSAIAKIKEWGFSEVGFGKSLRQIYDKNAMTPYQKLVRKTMVPAGKADEKTWTVMWEAVKREVSDKRPDLRKGTKAYLESVAKRFNEIITKTQVVSTIFDTAPIMRSKDLLVQAETAFMNEPIKTYNNLYRSFYEHSQNPKSKLARRQLTAAIAGTAINAILIGAVTEAFTMIRDPEDDEDKTAGKFAAGVLKNAGSDVLGMFPYVKSIMSILSGYDSERIDYKGLSTLVGGLVKTGKDAYTMYTGGTPDRTVISDVNDVINGVGYVLGLPVSGVTRDIKAFAYNVAQWTDSELLEYNTGKVFTHVGNGNGGSNKEYYDLLYKAYNHGDLIEYNAIRADMMREGVEEKNIASAMSARHSEEFDKAYETLYGAEGEGKDFKKFEAKTSLTLGISAKTIESQMEKRREADYDTLYEMYKDPEQKAEYRAQIQALLDIGVKKSDIFDALKKRILKSMEPEYDALYAIFKESGTNAKEYSGKRSELSKALVSLGMTEAEAGKTINTELSDRRKADRDELLKQLYASRNTGDSKKYDELKKLLVSDYGLSAKQLDDAIKQLSENE